MHTYFSFRLGAALAALVLVGGVLSSAAAEKKRLLVVTQSAGFRHGPVKLESGQELTLTGRTLKEIGAESGLFEIEESQDTSKSITAENLKRFDAVLFYTTGMLPTSDEQKEAFLDFIKSGKGFIGVHSATDTFKKWPGYYQLINGSFDGHPWGAGTTVTIANHETSHPTVAMFGREFQFKDEIYQYSNYDPSAVRVLLSLDMAKNGTKRPYQVPVCWVRTYGKGRMFYTNLGHNNGSWSNPKFRQHLLEGFRWSTGLVGGKSEPNPDLQAAVHVKSFLAVEAKDNAAELGAKVDKLDRNDLRHLAGHVDQYKALLRKKGADEERKAAAAEILSELE